MRQQNAKGRYSDMDLHTQRMVQHIMSCDCEGCRAVSDATARLEMVKQEREYRVGLAGIRLQSEELLVSDIAPQQDEASMPPILQHLLAAAESFMDTLLTDVDMCMRCGQNEAPRVWGNDNTFAFRSRPPGTSARHPQTGEFIQTLCDDCKGELRG